MTGDDLVPDPLMVVDRYATLTAPPEDVWPWLVQVGKERGGWYFPRWAERWLPPGGRGARTIVPEYQDVSVGMEEPDWGPGDPIFRCAVFDPPHALVWHTLRDTKAGHRWPVDERSPDVINLSWALLPSADGAGGTHLHIRLRMDKPAWRTDPLYRFKEPLFDFFDWATVVALFAGLRERLAA